MPTLYSAPIWRDTYYTTDAAVANYRIELDGNPIFSGKAVRYPDAEELKININKICRNYLHSDIRELLETLPGSRTIEDQPLAQRRFNLYVDDVNVADYLFYQDYSYDSVKPDSGYVITSNPINGHYTPGMLRLRTNRVTSNTPTVYTEGQTGEPTQDDYYYHYTTTVKCSPYVLYYLNSYGGWDAFVIEGTAKKKDAYNTFQTDQVYDNNTIEFEYNRYVNEIKTSYELNTGYLTDEQSENLAKNLLGSIKVYLHNIPEGKVVPVLIDDKNVTYQTYQTNGRKLSQYKITVTESQSKIRK